MKKATTAKKFDVRYREVLLLIESSRAYGRGCLMGIASYLRTHAPWHVVHVERSLEEQVPFFLRNQRFDGVIARIENDRIAESIRKMQVPTVDLRGEVHPEGGVTFDTDPVACSELAFQHFSERGFRNLAFCGYSGVKFSDQRLAAFLACCERANLQSFVFEHGIVTSKSEKAKAPGVLQREMNAELPDSKLVAWLAGLPAPIGIFCCNDTRGRQVLQACKLANRQTPEQIAVLGVDDDEVICELAYPSLSSIEPDTNRMGYEAAAALDSLMTAQKVENSFVWIPPRRISVRHSTDLLAIEDKDLAAAIKFIRDNACRGVNVKDVSEAVAISRVTLERRFRECLNRTPREEIERVRISRVKTMLLETNLSLIQIAHLTGYRSDAHLITAFRRHENCSPGVFRRNASA